MDTNLKRRIEKVLKQNLKRKVAFSLGLVVSYLISGNLLYAGAEGLKANLEELNANLVVREATFETDLQAEIARIKALMAENRQKRAEIWFDYQELIRKGDFYSKPIYPSSQIFFTYGYEHSARNKNRTTSEWQSTIGDISAKLAGVGLPKGKNPYHAGELIAYANGSMQDVGSQAALAWVYGYNTTGTAGGQLMAAYDKNGYNPNITPDSLSGTAAAKYMRPTYVYLDTAKTQPSVLTPPAGAAVVYDSVGNAYLQFTDGSGVLRTVQQGTNIEVATDSAGKVIVSNSLLDPKIGGSNPSTSLMAEAEAKNGDVALGEVVDGRGVYIDDPPHAEAIDVGANIKPLSPTIPDVSKTVTVDVSTPASITLPGMPFTPTQPGSVTPPSSPAVSVTPPDAVGAITVSPPSGVTPNIGSLSATPVTPNITPPNIVTTLVTPPTAPDPPDPPSITVVPGSFVTESQGNGMKAKLYDTSSGSTSMNGLMSSVNITNGQFVITRIGDKKWKFSAANYTASDLLDTATGTIPSMPVTNGTIADKYGFYLVNQSPLGFIGKGNTAVSTQKVQFDVYRFYDEIRLDGGINSPEIVREFAHLDAHNTASYEKIYETLYAIDTGISSKLTDIAKRIETNAAFNPGVYNGSSWTTSISNDSKFSQNMSVFVNDGEINLYGRNQTFVNGYIHLAETSGRTNDSGTLVAMNTGNITVYPYTFANIDHDDKTSTPIISGTAKGNNAIFVISPQERSSTNNTNSTPVKSVSYNSGAITLVDSPSSAVYIVDNTGSTSSYEAPLIAYAINRGSISVGGGYIYSGDTQTTWGSNSTWDWGEYTDVNNNGSFDTGEDFFDGDGNLKYNPNSTPKGSIGVYLKDIYKKGSLTDYTLQGGMVLDFYDGTNYYPISFTDSANVGLYVSPTHYYNSASTNIPSTNIRGTFAASFNGGTQNAGIYSKNGLTLTNHQLVFDKTTSSLGVGGDTGFNTASGSDTITLGEGKIEIKGGSKNVGISAKNAVTTNTTGQIILGADSLSNKGKENTAVYATGSGHTVNVTGASDTTSGIKVTDTENSQVLFAQDSAVINLGDSTNKGHYDINLTGPNSVALVVMKDGKINISNQGVTTTNSSTTATSPATSQAGVVVSTTTTYLDQYTLRSDKIVVTGGMAMYAGGTTGTATITAENSYIKVNRASATDTGQTAIFVASNGSIDVKNSVIDFDSIGRYAVYNSGGTIDLTGTDILLRGQSLGMNKGGTGTTTTTATTRIIMLSNDAIAFTESNVSGTKVVSGSTGTTSNLQYYFTNGVSILPGQENGTWYEQYAIAAVDGASIKIDSNISKSGSGTYEDFYFKRFIGQKIKLEVDADVTAVLTATDLTFNRFNNQVVALEGNSSTTASAVGDTTITINANKTVTADRVSATASNPGAIGVFINYGQLTNSGTINVEQINASGTNIPNDGAVGVYSVNGSESTNKKDINVGGDNSIGILGYGYRYALGDDPSTATFEGSTHKYKVTTEGFGDQKITIVNDAGATITLTGDGTVGIYAENNKSASPSMADSSVTNKGTITVGKDKAVGIYAYTTKVTLDAGSVITVGTGSVGVNASGYGSGQSSLVTAVSNNLGKLVLGDGSTGIQLDKYSHLSTGNMALEIVGPATPTADIIGINFEGTGGTMTSSTTDLTGKHSIDLDIDASAVSRGVILNVYDGAILNSAGDLTLGTAPTTIAGPYNDLLVGIHAGGAANKGSIASNEGTISLDGPNIVGMYTKNGAIANRSNGVIEVNLPTDGTTSQIGMFVEGAIKYTIPTLTITISPTLTYSAAGTIDGGGFAYNNGTINLNVAGSVGIYAKNEGTVTLNGSGITFNDRASYGVVADDSTVDIGRLYNYDTTGTYNALAVAAANSQLIWSTVQHNVAWSGGAQDGNILILAKNGSTVNNRIGSGTAQFIVGDSSSVVEDNTIGVYLYGGGNAYYDRPIASSLSTLYVYNKAIGVYSSGKNTINLNATIETNMLHPNTGATIATVGAYIGGFTNDISGKVTASGSTGTSIGIYVNKDSGGTIGVANIVQYPTSGRPLDLNVGDHGVGMYLESDSYATGEAIYITGLSGASNFNPGLYYTKGTSSSGAVVTHDTNLYLYGGKVIGLYTDDGIKLTTSKKIEYWTGTTENVGTYVSGASEFTYAGNDNNVKTKKSVGIYVADGIGRNGAVTVTGGVTTVTGGTMAVTGGATFAAADNPVGMVVDAANGKTATGINNGTITVNNATTGVYINASTASTSTYNYYNGEEVAGTKGLIKITGSGVGIALDETTTGQVLKAGKLDMGFGSSVGIYSDGGDVDFDVELTGKGVGVYAQKGSTSGKTATISGTIDGSGMTGGVTFYVNDDDTEVIMDSTTNPTFIAGQENVGVYFNDSYVFTNATIKAQKLKSTGAYVNKDEAFTLGANSEIIVGDTGAAALGVFVDGSGATMTTLRTQGGKLTIYKNGVGIYNSGSKATTTVGDIGSGGSLTVDFQDPSAVLAYNYEGLLQIGNNITITAASGRGVLALDYNGDLENYNGSILVNDGSAAFVGVFDSNAAKSSYTVENTTAGSITVTKGIGMAIVDGSTLSPATGGSPTATITLKNEGYIKADGSTLTGTDAAVGIYANVGAINNTNGTVDVQKNGIGIFAEGSVSQIDVGTLTVTEGVGLTVKGIAPPPMSGAISLNAGTALNRSIGTFFINMGGTLSSFPAVTHLGDYTVTAVFEDDATFGSSPLTVGTGSTIAVSNAYKNEIGVIVKDKGGLITFNDPFTIDGQENMGLYAENSMVNFTSNIMVSNLATADPTYATSSIGVYALKGYVDAQTVDVGKNNIGIYGDKAEIDVDAVKAASTGIGIYSVGDGINTDVTVGTINADPAAYGVFGKDSDIIATGPISVGADTAIGIISQGKGDVDVYGKVTVADKATTASIGIYKEKGSGTITTYATAADWVIGKGGYGIYVENAGNSGQIDIYNNVDMGLAESGVGIYASGKEVYAHNYGEIDVGPTYLGASASDPEHKPISNHLNSIGMYLANGASGENNSTGVINVNYDHSVGVYVNGKGASDLTEFVNSGTLNVDGGAVGILAVGMTKVTNNGQITVGSVAPSCGGESIGIAAYGEDDTRIARVVNNGTITVKAGTGVYLNQYAELYNYGTIDVKLGATGVKGLEGTIKAGYTNFTGAGTPIAYTDPEFPHGAINILEDGTVVVNNMFIHAGTLIASNVIADNVKVSILNALNQPMFQVDGIKGTIELLPDFITTGNGYGWTVPNFVANVNGGLTSGGFSVSDISIKASPLFVAHMTQLGSLVVAKQPYAYLVTGTQFDNLYNGMDSLLALDQAGLGRDSQILKGLNAYLDEIYRTQGQDAFDHEADRTLAEMRGDIYATMQDRIQDINRTFDRAFEELLDSYNYTRESGKWSVIYQQGDFRDDTVGIDSYDYRVQGFLYMKEFEGRRYYDKWGWSLGFTASRFDFDDAPKFYDRSKEDVYSVRVGAHLVKSIGGNDRLRWISRVDLGYNRHDAERSIELDRLYKNSAQYDSFTVSFDNKLEKTLYRSLETNINAYAGLNLEYGHISKFTEHGHTNADGTITGGLELDIKGRDWYSIEGEIGVKGTKRLYLGKKVSAKLSGDVAYAYEFGNNHKANRGRVNGGTEDYYDLIKPAREKGVGKARASLTIEKRDHIGVSFDVEARKYQNKSGTDLRYGVRFTYKF